MSVGQNIKDIRQAKMISRESLSEMIDMSVHAIAKYEQNQREPNLEILQKIATALNSSIFDLIDPLTASKDLLMESLKEDEDKKELLKQKQSEINNEINKRLALLNISGSLEALKRIDDLRLRKMYRAGLGINVQLANEKTLNEIDNVSDIREIENNL